MKKEIKPIGQPEFYEEFAKHFPNGEISQVPLKTFPNFLTNSQILKENTLWSLALSGSASLSILGYPMGFLVARYDKPEGLRGGSPVNLDAYIIEGMEEDKFTLSKILLPTELHKSKFWSYPGSTSLLPKHNLNSA